MHQLHLKVKMTMIVTKTRKTRAISIGRYIHRLRANIRLNCRIIAIRITEVRIIIELGFEMAVPVGVAMGAMVEVEVTIEIDVILGNTRYQL